MEYREYWSEIESIAQSVTAEAAEHDRDIYEVLHETLDGHEFVIYTRKAQEVIALSPNDDAFRDSGLGPIDSSDSNPMFWSQVAYCAMEQDVLEHGAFNEDIDEDEE